MPDKRQVLTQWVEAYTDELYAWAIRKTSNTTVAEDLVQETFLSAAESWHTFRGASQPKTWLFGILRHKIAGYYRDKAGAPVQLVPTDEASAFFDRKGQWLEQEKPQEWGANRITEAPAWPEFLDQCLRALPPVMALCLELTYLQGKKGKEVYETLNITAANYWQSMSRARLKLRHCLEKARLASQIDTL